MDTDKSIRFEHPSRFRPRPLLSASRLRRFLFLSVALGLLFFGYRHSSHYSSSRTALDVGKLGDFEFDGQHGTLADIPEQFRNLDGQRVTLRGLMWAPAANGSTVSGFQLVKDLDGSGHEIPLVQNRVFCSLPDGQTAPYFSNYVDVTGILHVRVANPSSEKVISVYLLDVENVTLDSPEAGK
jgi:hypothetical protein